MPNPAETSRKSNPADMPRWDMFSMVFVTKNQPSPKMQTTVTNWKTIERNVSLFRIDDEGFEPRIEVDSVMAIGRSAQGRLNYRRKARLRGGAGPGSSADQRKGIA